MTMPSQTRAFSKFKRLAFLPPEAVTEELANCNSAWSRPLTRPTRRGRVGRHRRRASDPACTPSARASSCEIKDVACVEDEVRRVPLARRGHDNDLSRRRCLAIWPSHHLAFAITTSPPCPHSRRLAVAVSQSPPRCRDRRLAVAISPSPSRRRRRAVAVSPPPSRCRRRRLAVAVSPSLAVSPSPLRDHHLALWPSHNIAFTI